MHDTITLYVGNGEADTLIDYADHVRLALYEERRYHIIISTIFDDGDNVGPENTEAVAPTIEAAHAFIARRFNTDQMRTERVDESALSAYRLFFGNDEESDMTILLHLVELVTG